MMSLIFDEELDMAHQTHRTHAVKKKHPPAVQRGKVEVRPKSSVVRRSETVVAESAEAKVVRELVAYWDDQFLRAAGIPDESISARVKETTMKKILGDIGDESRVRRLIVVMLTHKRAEWINNKTLTWLAAPKNRTYLAPLLMKSGSARTAEFQGARSRTLQFKFRK